MKKILAMLMTAVMLLGSVTLPEGVGQVAYAKENTENPYTGDVYSHNEKFDDRTIVNGIDVSQWQGRINWKKVKADGIDFAFIRVGYRGYGSAGVLNESTIDTYFDYNMRQAVEAGVDVGVYVFSQAITVKEAEEEAQYILDHIKGYNVKLPLVLDYEYAGDADGPGRLQAANLSKAKATNICLAFCKKIDAAGYTPMVYANPSMMKDQLYPKRIEKAGYRVWLANYTSKTEYTGDYDFWQYSSTGKVKGISTDVDMNFYYKQATDNFLTVRKSIKRAQVSDIANYNYTGSAIEPEVELTYKGKLLEEGYNYSLAYRNNLLPGKATVVITGLGKFRGTLKKDFIIKPEKMGKISVITKEKNSITLGWQSNSNVSGYQVYRASAKDGKYKRVKTIKDSGRFYFIDKNLEPGKKYYYKIRSYVEIDGKRYYGEFSDITRTNTSIGGVRKAIARKAVRVYKSADTTSNVVFKLNKNALVDAGVSVEDILGNVWYPVTCEEDGITYKGYVPADNLIIGTKGILRSARKVSLMSKASPKATIVTKLSSGSEVVVIDSVIKKDITWYKVAYIKKNKLYTGWIDTQTIDM